MPVLWTYIFFTTHKAYFIFIFISNVIFSPKILNFVCFCAILWINNYLLTYSNSFRNKKSINEVGKKSAQMWSEWDAWKLTRSWMLFVIFIFFVWNLDHCEFLGFVVCNCQKLEFFNTLLLGEGGFLKLLEEYSIIVCTYTPICFKIIILSVTKKRS